MKGEPLHQKNICLDGNRHRSQQQSIDHDVELFRKDRIKAPQTMFEDCYETMPNSLKNQQKKFKEYETN